ncbi:MAG: MerR family DNA-binding transcriptional regulator [Candidatus Thiodiazotropha sp.]
MAEKKTYSIRNLASEFDITIRSIRFYEDQGLLSPIRRGQTRIYNSNDRVRLILILRGKRLGFSLAEIDELLSLWDRTPSGSEKQLKLLLEKITLRKAELEQQMEDIVALQIELSQAERSSRKALRKLKAKRNN